MLWEGGHATLRRGDHRRVSSSHKMTADAPPRELSAVIMTSATDVPPRERSAATLRFRLAAGSSGRSTCKPLRSFSVSQTTQRAFASLHHRSLTTNVFQLTKICVS